MDMSVQVLSDQIRRYDITPAGKQFIVVSPATSTATLPNQEIFTVLNWFEELKQHVPVH
jgi:hypothetical protein